MRVNNLFFETAGKQLYHNLELPISNINNQLAPGLAVRARRPYRLTKGHRRTVTTVLPFAKKLIIVLDTSMSAESQELMMYFSGLQHLVIILPLSHHPSSLVSELVDCLGAFAGFHLRSLHFHFETSIRQLHIAMQSASSQYLLPTVDMVTIMMPHTELEDADVLWERVGSFGIRSLRFILCPSSESNDSWASGQVGPWRYGIRADVQQDELGEWLARSAEHPALFDIDIEIFNLDDILVDTYVGRYPLSAGSVVDRAAVIALRKGNKLNKGIQLRTRADWLATDPQDMDKVDMEAYRQMEAMSNEDKRKAHGGGTFLFGCWEPSGQV